MESEGTAEKIDRIERVAGPEPQTKIQPQTTSALQIRLTQKWPHFVVISVLFDPF